MIIHLGETVPEATDELVYRISAATLVLWTVTVFFLMLLTFGIGAASGLLFRVQDGTCQGGGYKQRIRRCLICSG